MGGCGSGLGTFRWETRSAVSRRVSCDIWSTIVVILGFVLAVVDSWRRWLGGVGFRRWWRKGVDERAMDGREDGRRALVQ